MRYWIEYADGRCCNFANSRKDLLDWLKLLKDEKIDGILLAGDVFDRAVPPIEAIELWDSIITRLAMDYKVPLFVVSGNHDGAERLEVGRSMLSRSGIHIWGSPHHALQPFAFEGADGKVAICPIASLVALGMH